MSFADDGVSSEPGGGDPGGGIHCRLSGIEREDCVEAGSASDGASDSIFDGPCKKYPENLLTFACKRLGMLYIKGGVSGKLVSNRSVAQPGWSATFGT